MCVCILVTTPSSMSTYKELVDICDCFIHFVYYVQQHPYSCYVHFRHDDIACVVVTDQEYPQRVAFTLIHKVIDDFKAKHPQASWTDDEKYVLRITHFRKIFSSHFIDKLLQ